MLENGENFSQEKKSFIILGVKANKAKIDNRQTLRKPKISNQKGFFENEAVTSPNTMGEEKNGGKQQLVFLFGTLYLL